MSKSNKEKAVALKYNPETGSAPVVIASGYGHVAEGIIDIAEQKGIPVYKDDSAASMLCMLEVGSNIPPELYEIVATIYVELLKTAGEIKNNSASPQRRTSLKLKSRQTEEDNSDLSEEQEIE
ncbi:MAG: EscU/YscU/HrcU family type III secretion system export apparatus switch protein [Oscillospiraceae bacterium]